MFALKFACILQAYMENAIVNSLCGTSIFIIVAVTLDRSTPLGNDKKTIRTSIIVCEREGE